MVEANTFDSDYDTILIVVTGSPGNFTVIDCNDDSGISGNEVQSQVTFNAVAGVTYYFMVGSKVTGGGNLVFNVNDGVLPTTTTVEPTTTTVEPTTTTSVATPPANDEFLNATAIGPLPFTNSLDTSAATVSSDDPSPTAILRSIRCGIKVQLELIRWLRQTRSGVTTTLR